MQHHFRHEQHHLNKKPLHKKVLYYLLAIMIIIAISTLLATNFQSVYPQTLIDFYQRISVVQILLYGLFTLTRVTIAYTIGLFMTMIFLFLIIKFRRIENFIMPVFDILQSVPVLAFFPLIIVTFANLHMPELAAQIVLIVACFWSVFFGAIGGFHQIPQDILDAAKIYNAKGPKLFFKVILPAIFPALVTGSILSFGASWNVIIISEYINYGNISIRLPGLGNLLSSSAGRDTGVFIASLLMLVIIIFTLDRLVWHPLTEHSQKYKFE
ncbi:MAG: putative transporter permease protein [Candidatus Doudnabacteria bacterium]|nr:putative transporter permease protein [Candidatus Doudnabacteria bacterium]